MDIILLGITIVSLVVALVMSVAAWRLMRDEKKRSAARVAALSVAAAARNRSWSAASSREPENRAEKPMREGAVVRAENRRRSVAGRGRGAGC